MNYGKGPEISPKNTKQADFLQWLGNELTRPFPYQAILTEVNGIPTVEGGNFVNSFLATDDENRMYSITLQRPIQTGDKIEVFATAVTETGSLGDWGKVITFQCLQLTSDTCQLTIGYRNLPGIEEYFNQIVSTIRDNFPIMATRAEPKAKRRVGRPPKQEENWAEFVNQMAYAKTVEEYKETYPAWTYKDIAKKYGYKFGYGYNETDIKNLENWRKKYREVIETALESAIPEIEKRQKEILGN